MFKAIRKAKSNEKGFTLVELMVVVVIIGILVAIAIPVYGGIQGRANAGAAQATLRTIDGAVAVLAAENNKTPATLTDADVTEATVQAAVEALIGFTFASAGPDGIAYSLSGTNVATATVTAGTPWVGPTSPCVLADF